MSHASLSSIKEKEIQKKRNIKSRKIDKRKRKMLVSKAFHNTMSLGLSPVTNKPYSSKHWFTGFCSTVTYYVLILM